MDLSEIRRFDPPLTYSPHPLVPGEQRVYFHDAIYEGETIADYLERTGLMKLVGRRPIKVTINGCSVPRELWHKVKPKRHSKIHVQAVVNDRGGGAGKVLRTVAMIAIAVYAKPLAGFFLGSTGAIAQGAVMIAGSLLVNALFPPPMPHLSDVGGVGDASPTYALTGGSNRMRPYEPMPVIMGEHRVYPDLSAQPYTEFEGDDQYLYQIFNFGFNDVELSDFRIGDTPIEQFAGVQVEVSDSDGKLHLFPGNVDSIEGAELTQAAGWIQRTSSADATALAIELSGSLFQLTENGDVIDQELIIEINYRKVGEVDWTALQVASDAYQQIDTGGGGWLNGVIRLAANQLLQHMAASLPPGRIRIVNNSREPLKRKFYWTVEPGQYEIRVRRLTQDFTGSKWHFADVTWTQLRTYQTDTGDYTGQKRVALKIRASGQLNGVVQQFSALAKAKCLVWNGSEWVKQHTRNPAWWSLQAARGVFVDGRRVWGAGLPDSRIDVDTFKDFATWCTNEGLTFDAVFDQPKTAHEMLNAIMLRGRATPSWAAGKLAPVWDAPNLPVVGVFSMANIEAGSFEIEYASEELADEVVANFINRDKNYERDTVRALAPGVTVPKLTRSIELFGCTVADIAGQDAHLYLANNIFRSRRYRWRMDFEGMPASRGEVGVLAHDLASFDVSGRLVEGSTATTLKLERTVPLQTLGAYVMVVKPDGSKSVHAVPSGVGSTDTLDISGDPLAYDPSADPDHSVYDYKFLYSSNSVPGRKVKIESIRPVSDSQVEITALDEVPEYYAAKSGSFQYTPPSTGFGAAPVIDQVAFSEEGVRVGEGYAVKVVALWNATGNYTFADLRLSVNGGDFRPLAQNVRDRRQEFIVSDGSSITLEITAYGNLGRLGKRSISTHTYNVDFASKSIPGDVTGFSAGVISTGIELTWAKAADVDVTEYEVRIGESWESGTQIFRGRALRFVDVPRLPGTYTYWAKQYDAAQQESENAVSAQVTVTTIGAPAVSAIIEQTDAVLSWIAPASQFDIEIYEVRYGASWETAVVVGRTKATTLKVPVDWLGSRNFLVAAIDIAKQTGAAGSIAVSVSAALAPVNVQSRVAGENAVISWEAPASSLPIREYEIRYGGDYASGTPVTRIKGTSHTLKVDWSGARTFWVAAYDSNNNPGAAASTTLNITPPSAPVLSQQVIDNNVLLSWTDAAQTLPLRHYEVRRGGVFNTATIIGTVGARFTVLFEDSQGDYTYWVVGVDSAGNVGTPSSITASVAQPPNFILYDDLSSQMDGTNRSNWLTYGGTPHVLEFGGNTELQYGMVPSIPHLDGGITGLTFETWVIPALMVQNGGILEKNVGGVTNTCAQLHIEGGMLTWRGKLSGGGTVDAEINISSYDPYRPLHVIGRWSAANGLRLSVNGTTVATTPLASLAQGVGSFYLGRLGNSGYYFTGGIGPSRVYKRELNDTEVLEHYRGVYKDESELVAAWNMSEGSGDIVFDDSPNSYDLQLFSDPVWKPTILDGRYDLSLAQKKSYFPSYVGRETAQEWWSRIGAYATVQAAVAAGHTHPLASAPTTAYYEEVVDYGTVIPSTKIAVTVTNAALFGAVSLDPTISIRRESTILSNRTWTLGEMMEVDPADTTGNASVARQYLWEVTTAGTTTGKPSWPATVTPNVTTVTQNGVQFIARAMWTDFVGLWSAYATNFRYVKVRIAATGAGGQNVLEAPEIRIKLDVKLKSDAGTAQCFASDVGGTLVTFTPGVNFADVHSIVITPRGTVPVDFIVDFQDVPNPTGFKVLLFDKGTGVRVNGTVSWSAEGV